MMISGAVSKTAQTAAATAATAAATAATTAATAAAATAAAAAAPEGALVHGLLFVCCWRLLRASFLLPLLLRAATQQLQLHRYTRGVIAAAAAAQRLYELAAPWQGASPSSPFVFFAAAEVLRRVALLLLPVCPQASRELLQQLNLQQQQEQQQQQQQQQQGSSSYSLAWGSLGVGGGILPKPTPLFPPLPG
ncbi:uncharacterized protein EMH_0027520 [Eimeria mitis]|uniref:Uncharacterized protein n=1 Tax=Eimeria mitis TaxID=44415 RepID=U6JPX6_9EIME|nr:uncharacterized protein EMH_0027520 [Eimeria mitis]CDJ26916.1 hypothetical protein EMH_0027520 [Eimeria mitis]